MKLSKVPSVILACSSSSTVRPSGIKYLEDSEGGYIQLFSGQNRG